MFWLKELTTNYESIILPHESIRDYPLNFDLYGGFITRFVPAQGLELAGKPYAWIKRIPNSSCARLSAGIARPVTWKILFFLLGRAHLSKVQANALTFYSAIYD